MDTPPAYMIDLDLFGISDHSNHSVIYRQVNPGLGLTLGRIVDENVDWTLAIGTYLDSYNAHARYAMTGPRFVVGDRASWHASLTLACGYLNGSGSHGAAIIPVVQVGYDRVGLCITGDRAKPTHTYNPDNNPGFAPTAVIACFVEVEVLRF